MKKKSAADKDSFSERMIKILNYGALNLALAIGYRTGLFDAMDLFEIPQTVEGVSEKTGLNPRYLAEWLGVMVTGEIVELSRDAIHDQTRPLDVLKGIYHILAHDGLF